MPKNHDKPLDATWGEDGDFPGENADGAQMTKARDLLTVLERGELTVYVTVNGLEVEKSFDDAVDIILTQGGITESMAETLMTRFTTALAQSGKTAREVKEGLEPPPGDQLVFINAGEEQEAIGVDLFDSINEALQTAARPGVPDKKRASSKKNPQYGDFTYHVDFGAGLEAVSIIEAVAWLKHTGQLLPGHASRLMELCASQMMNTPCRMTAKRNPLKPTATRKPRTATIPERTRELELLKRRAAGIAKREIKMPGLVESLQIQLGNAYRTLDFMALADTPYGIQSRPFLETILQHRKNGQINDETATSLAEKCINTMLAGNIPSDNIVGDLAIAFEQQLLTEEELSTYIGMIYPDPDYAAPVIRTIVAVSLGPDQAHKTGGPESPGFRTGPGSIAPVIGIPQIATRGRLALLGAGLLVVAAGGITAIVSSTGSPARENSQRPPAASRINVDIPTSPPVSETSAFGPPTFASKVTPVRSANKPHPEKPPPPAQNAGEAEGQNSNQPALIPLKKLGQKPETPSTISVPVVLKPGKAKIDTAASRALWEKKGYRVGISMGLSGKKIRLTTNAGAVYLLDTSSLSADTTDLGAILQNTE